MPKEDLIISPETTFATWVTPALAFPVTKASVKAGIEKPEKKYSGSTRGVSRIYQGAKAPAGSVEMDLWSEHMGKWLKAAGLDDIATTTPGGATTAREHGFLLGTNPLLKSLSAQIKRSAAHGQNLLGMVIDKITIKAVKKEVVTIAFDFLCKDEALCGATWDYDGSSSPAIISTPTYISASISPFIFYHATLKTGGTPTFDDAKNQFTFTGQTTQGYVESFELSISNSLEQAHFLTTDRTPKRIAAGDLAVDVKIDVDMSSIDDTFYNNVRNHTTSALELTLAGANIEASQPYMFKLVLPEALFKNADHADIGGDHKRRVMSVEASAQEHAASDQIINIVLRDTQTAY